MGLPPRWREGVPLYLAGGEGWAARLHGAHLPARGAGLGGRRSLGSAAIPPSPAAWPSAGQPVGEKGGHAGDSEAARGPGSCARLVRARLYLVLHQPVAGRTLLAAGARRVGEVVGLAPVTLVAHEARVTEAGAVLVALRGDGAQRGAVAGCSGGRKASRCGCQPQFWDRGTIPVPVTSAAPGREAEEAVVASVALSPRDAWLAGALPCQRVAPTVLRPHRVALTAGTERWRVMSKQRMQGTETRAGDAEPPLSPRSPTYLLHPTPGCRP